MRDVLDSWAGFCFGVDSIICSPCRSIFALTDRIVEIKASETANVQPTLSVAYVGWQEWVKVVIDLNQGIG